MNADVRLYSDTVRFMRPNPPTFPEAITILAHVCSARRALPRLFRGPIVLTVISPARPRAYQRNSAAAAHPPGILLHNLIFS